MKKPLLSILLFTISYFAFAQPGNDACGGATVLTIGTDCTPVNGTLQQAANSSPTGCGGNEPDVWFRFTAPAGAGGVTFATIKINPTSIPSQLNTGNLAMELFSTSACPGVSAGCGNATSSRTYTVVPNTSYLIRVYTTQNNSTSNDAGQWNFNICVTSNNNCATATTITPGGTISEGSLHSATVSTTLPPTGCSNASDAQDDVWYKFTAVNTYASITLSNVSNALSTAGARFQVFNSTGGNCATLTSKVCSNTPLLHMNDLVVGNVYFIRVYSAGTNNIGSGASAASFAISVSPGAPIIVGSGRMKEVFQQTVISPPQVLADPWEITYANDGYLWITESKGSCIYRMDPVTGIRDTVLNISQNSTFFSSPADQAFNLQFNIGTNNPQGGLAGMAFHPNFLATTGAVNSVYVAYVHTYVGVVDNGTKFVNRLVKFTYNPTTKKLESPVSVCDTLPGSNDHNSQRVIIAPVDNVNYVFYASGDMGSGQFSNQSRAMRAQQTASYEGKILRFNLIEDGDTGLDAWIPNDNPFNTTIPAKQNAVYAFGIRNNQGFAYDTARKILYGASHGPHSDDEINIIERAKNYGHPMVIGYAADNNYNGISAGANSTNTCPVIGNETTNAANYGTAYKDPLFSGYPRTQAEIYNHWNVNTPNGTWPSEGWSGMDFYSANLIPNWKHTLLVSSLKWGRVLKFRLGPNGNTIIPTENYDTVSYFGSVNRFRDLAFSPNGKDMYVIMDRSTSTSGPSAANPVIAACQGCVQKYTFLGYNDAAGKSEIPKSIDITDGAKNVCIPGTTIEINSSNNNYWVPITGPDGNIMAEIKANGQNLGTVTSSFRVNSGPVRQNAGKYYLDRSITINVSPQPASPVAVRFYITGTEFNALNAATTDVNAIGDLRIIKNNDACLPTVGSSTTLVPLSFSTEAHDSTGYVLMTNVSSFSTFYFGNQPVTLPVNLISFTGALQNNVTILDWKTAQEINSSHFVVERSIDGNNFTGIGSVQAKGTGNGGADYTLPDNDVANLQSNIVYYRLKIVDLDGQFTYSEIISVSLDFITGRVTVAPNPAVNEIRVSVTAPLSGKAKWNIVDNSGRVVLSSHIELKKGINQFPINLQKLAAGLYYLNMEGSGIDQHLKIQKL